MNKISTMTELENIFQEAKKNDAEYVMVKISMQGFEKPEVIVNPKENIDSKLEYYKKAYKEDLHLKTFDGIQIVEAGYMKGNPFKQINVESIFSLIDIPKEKYTIYYILGSSNLYTYDGKNFVGLNNGDIYIINDMDEFKLVKDLITTKDVILVKKGKRAIIKDENGQYKVM